MSSYSARRPARIALRLLTGAALAALTAGAAMAQDVEEEATEVEEIVVNGVRTLPGQVIGDITPELTISPREIRAYGAASVTELIEALAPQTNSGQGSGGRPVVLINGGRVSGFAEIRDLPTEAIARVDILPEEVSLKYGYPAEQKVLNIVLRQRFRATLVEAGANVPTEGAGETYTGHAGLLRIQQGQRLTLDAKVTDTQPIFESDRDIIDGEGDFRTLQPGSTNVSLNAVLAQPLGNGVSGSLNGVFDGSETNAKLGLSPFSSEALNRRSDAKDMRLAASATGAYAGWQWSYTGELAYNLSRTATDRAFGGIAYLDRTWATTRSAQSDIVLNRALWELPAGQVSTTFTGRVSTTSLESEALRAGINQSSDLSRSIGELKASFDVPLTRAGEGLGDTLGKLSANANFGLQELSDFGALETVGAGLNWSPVKPVRVLASFSRTDSAPTMNQLGDPVSATPGSRVFDLQRDETVEVIRVTGGSPNLGSSQRDVFKLGITYKPFEETNLNLQANYVSSRTRDVIAAFPSSSTQVEDAFPERFIRDADGVLIQVDARPVNFAKQSRDELRYGFTYSRPVGPTPTPEQIAAMRRRASGQAGTSAAPQQGPPAGGPDQPPEPVMRTPGDGGPPLGAGPGGPGMRGPGGGFGGFGGRGRGGVFQIGLYHTVAFRDEVLIREGVPVLDLLDGGAIGQGGGSPRHQVDLQTNFTRSGLGVAVNAKWESATRIAGESPEGDLEFSDLTTVNLRLFADLGALPIAREHRWLRGARATLAINNVFDERQDVRNANGTVPINYQPDLLDPVGRSIRFTVRKLIF